MKSKTPVPHCMTFSRRFLIISIVSMTIVIILMSVFSGCAQEEETPMQETRQLIIPSELEPEAVLPVFGGNEYDESILNVGDQGLIEAEELEKDFIRGYARGYWIYTLKSGKEIGVVHTLLDIYVLKYETPAAAEEAFNLFSERIDLKDLILYGVEIKGVEGKDHPKGATYMLQSNNFVIYVRGDIEAGRDAVSRIIELYSVPKDSKY